MTDTDTLRKLAEAATPGPWRKDLGDGNEMRFVSVDDANGVPIVMMDDFLEENGWTLDQSSIDFIAAANPTAVIALLDEIDALRAKVKRQAEALKPFADAWENRAHIYDHLPEFANCPDRFQISDLRRAAQEATDE